MQFIAEDPVNVVVRVAQPPIIDPNTRGVIQRGTRRLFAKFQRGTAPAWATKIGLALYEFRRQPQGVSPEQWLSFYDSIEEQQRNGWTDEERAEIEQKLLITDGVKLVEKPRVAAPWPSYDKLVAGSRPAPSRKEIVEKILAIIDEQGYDPQAVLAYESENKGRSEVMDAVSALLPEGTTFSIEDDEDGELIDA